MASGGGPPGHFAEAFEIPIPFSFACPDGAGIERRFFRRPKPNQHLASTSSLRPISSYILIYYLNIAYNSQVIKKERHIFCIESHAGPEPPNFLSPRSGAPGDSVGAAGREVSKAELHCRSPAALASSFDSRLTPLWLYLPSPNPLPLKGAREVRCWQGA